MGERTRKSLKQNPNIKLYVSAIAKNIILVFVVFISILLLCEKFIEKKKWQYRANHPVLPQKKTYLTSFKKTTNPNLSPKVKGSGFSALVRMFIRDLTNTPERTIIFQKAHIF